MRVTYGSYQHATNSVAVVITREALYSETGITLEWKETWTLTGRLDSTPATQSAVSALITALETAYSANGYDLRLLNDDGSVSAHFMKNSDTIGGVRVIQPPYFPKGDGPQMAGFRNFVIVLEGVFPQVSGNPIIAWQEKLEFVGTGGPVTVHVPVVNGPWQKQTVSTHSIVTVVQSGRSVGYAGYLPPPNPLWPSDEQVHLRRISTTTPRLLAGDRKEYEVSWSYTFEANTPMTGDPTIPQRL